jgi:hypothetical protein
MARILFTWELGGGAGHVYPYISLIKLLEGQGHEVFYALRDLSRVEKFFKGTNVSLLQAPVAWPVSKEDRLPAADTYAKILTMSGFMAAPAISGRLAAWSSIYQMVAPDLIVFDFSPTAMLAARKFPSKRLAIGTGFHLPPRTEPIPDICWHLEKRPDARHVIQFEQRVLQLSNEAALRNGIEPLDRLCDLFEADATIFRTFRELDHYPEREAAEYWGVSRAPPGISPDWPEGHGPKIFAYLKRFESMPALLNLLKAQQFPTLLYGDKLPWDAEQRFGSNTLKFAKGPVDMGHVGKHADLAISNAGHGTACELLVSGVPALMLPLNLEQQLVGANVSAMGAGLSVPSLKAEAISQALYELVNSGEYKKSAQRFSARNEDSAPGDLPERLARLIGSLTR